MTPFWTSPVKVYLVLDASLVGLSLRLGTLRLLFSCDRLADRPSLSLGTLRLFSCDRLAVSLFSAFYWGGARFRLMSRPFCDMRSFWAILRFFSAVYEVVVIGRPPFEDFDVSCI